MALNDVLVFTKKFISVIQDGADGLSLEGNDKDRAAAGCLQISIDHHAAIELLIEYGHRGSAAALVRPQFEAFLIGAWLHRCATDQKARKFLEDKNPPKLTAMIGELETYDYVKCGLSILNQKIWKGLCSYTHTGGLHVARRLTPTKIIANYSDEEMMDMLEVSNLVALIASYEISELAKNKNSVNAIYAAYTDIPKRS
jgi:hypothetical protein